MILKKFVPLFLVVLALFSTARSQVITNTAALRNGALRAQIQYQEMSSRLASLAKQKGWPLTINLKRGNLAVLYGLSPKGCRCMFQLTTILFPQQLSEPTSYGPAEVPV